MGFNYLKATEPLQGGSCNIAIYEGDTTLYSKCDQVSNLWQLVELNSEIESDLQDTVDLGRKWHVDFSAGKTQLILFDQSNNIGVIDVKMDGSVLGLTYSSRLGWGSCIISVAKTGSKKI